MSCHSLTKKIRVLHGAVVRCGIRRAFREEDDHYIQSDDYFISKEPYKTQPWMYVQLAKMKTPASAETRTRPNSCRLATGTMCGPKTTGRHALQPRPN
jgi:hypothetical protein